MLLHVWAGPCSRAYVRAASSTLKSVSHVSVFKPILLAPAVVVKPPLSHTLFRKPPQASTPAQRPPPHTKSAPFLLSYGQRPVKQTLLEYVRRLCNPNVSARGRVSGCLSGIVLSVTQILTPPHPPPARQTQNTTNLDLLTETTAVAQYSILYVMKSDFDELCF